jgi:hypothetical protein
MEEEMYLVDSCTTNTILREMKYFQTLKKRTGNILTIAGRDTCIVSFGKATIILLIGTQVTIENILFYPDSTCTLLSYRDIENNVLHIVTHEENNKESLLITKTNGDGYDILERIPSLPSELYYTYIKHIPHIAYCSHENLMARMEQSKALSCKAKPIAFLFKATKTSKTTK